MRVSEVQVVKRCDHVDLVDSSGDDETVVSEYVPPSDDSKEEKPDEKPIVKKTKTIAMVEAEVSGNFILSYHSRLHKLINCFISFSSTNLKKEKKGSLKRLKIQNESCTT